LIDGGTEEDLNINSSLFL